MNKSFLIAAIVVAVSVPSVSFALTHRIGVYYDDQGDENWVYEAGVNLQQVNEGNDNYNLIADTLPLVIKGIYARYCTTSYYAPSEWVDHDYRYQYWTGSQLSHASIHTIGDYDLQADGSKCRYLIQLFSERTIAPNTKMAVERHRTYITNLTYWFTLDD